MSDVPVVFGKTYFNDDVSFYGNVYDNTGKLIRSFDSDVDLTANNISANNISANSISATSTVSATSFVGDGSNLTNIQNAVGYNTKGYKFFSSPGTFVVGVDCPVGVTNVKITGCGGGGAGGSGGTFTPTGNGGGGGGGGGASHIQTFYRSVSNGETYTMIIGGAPGGSTTVSLPGPTNVFTLAGGTAGSNGTNLPVNGGAGGSAGANSPTNPLAIQLFGGLISATAGLSGGFVPAGPGSTAATPGNGGSGAFNTQYKTYGIGGQGGNGYPAPVAAPMAPNPGSGGFILVEW